MEFTHSLHFALMKKGGWLFSISLASLPFQISTTPQILIDTLTIFEIVFCVIRYSNSYNLKDNPHQSKDNTCHNLTPSNHQMAQNINDQHNMFVSTTKMFKKPDKEVTKATKPRKVVKAKKHSKAKRSTEHQLSKKFSG